MNILTKSNLFTVIVISTLILPPLIPKTSIRVDTLIIFVYSLILLFGKSLTFSKGSRIIVYSFLSLTIGAGIALLIQAIFLGEPYLLEYVYNFQGYTRPLLFAFVTAETIKSARHAESIVKIILFGIIYHGVVALLQYARLEPFASNINLLYRGSSDDFGYVRGLGAFATVHGLAYFGLYGLVFSLSIINFSSVKPSLRNLAYFASIASVASLIVPFSRSAWIATTISVAYLFANRINWRALLFLRLKWKTLQKMIAISVLVAIASYLTPTDVIYTLKGYSDDILLATNYFITGKAQDFQGVTFIEGRLDWGWQNAIETFKKYPLHGDLSARYKTFIGDGGYTESLSNHGFIGFISILIMFSMIWMTNYSLKFIEPSNRIWIKISLRSFVIGLGLASLATTMLQERSMELLPVMMISLILMATSNHNKVGLLPMSQKSED